MKIGVKFIIFLILLLLVISPVIACLDSDRIMRLYQETNSHGALYNDASGNYLTEVCYSEFFTQPYTNPNPHECSTGNVNKVIGLYDTFNAHGEIPSLDNYGNDICYGDLVCRKADSSAPCTGTGEVIVLSLFQDTGTNSHISKGNDPLYGNKICCKKTGPIVDLAFWTNMIDVVITDADLNDTVKLVARGQGFENKDITYQIYKDGFWFFDTSLGAQTSNKGYITWEANESGNFYFKATVGTDTKQSDIFTVSNTLHNSAPFAKIDNPKKGEIYGLSDTINFNQSSYDEDNYINYVWNFGDGNSASGSTRDSNLLYYNLTYSYETGALYQLSPFSSGTSSDGQKNVLLSVTDERGLNVEDMVSILVVDRTAIGKIYVFANILKPVWDEEIPPTQEFDATGSYAIKVNDTGGLECLAGDCPSGYDIGNIPITGPDYSLLSFTWKFNDETPDIPPLEGNPKYTKSFGINGKGIVNLTVTYNNSEKSSTYVEVKINPGGPGGKYCLNGVWYEGGTTYDTTQPIDKCKGLDGSAGTSDDCCPNTFFSCLENTTLALPHMYQCMLAINNDNDNYCTQNSINSCSDYTDANNCSADICNKRSQSCGSGTINNFCGDYSWATTNPAHCRCEWDNANGVCKQNRSYAISIGSISIEGSCSTQILSAGECEDGEMSVSQNSQESWQNLGDLYQIDHNLDTTQEQLAWVNANCKMSDICFTGNREIICGEETIKLDFFNWINLVIIIVILVIIYLIWNILKKSKRKDKKKTTGKKK